MTGPIPSLLATIVFSLVFAYIGGMLARAARLPPLVGYLLAGLAVGPITPGFVADPHLIGELADIGIALLLFGVGLHFSLADLLSVWRVAVPGALLQIVISTGIGFAISRWFFGWPPSASLLLGLSLAIASTAVATRALDDRGRLGSEAGHVAMGWLVMQDLVVILTMVLLPAITGLGGEGGASLGSVLGRTLLELVGFVVAVVLVGRRVIPWLLALTARSGSRELFTLAVIVTALGVAYGSAQLFGVSLALGAFFAGVVLAESDLSHQAAAESQSVQQLFTVLFFVSVGMLFDPSILIRQPLHVLAVLLAILIGTGFVSLTLLLVLRVSAVTAVAVAASLAQIGEFSFILSGQAVTQGMLPLEGRDLVLAAALLAIVANPFVFRANERLARWLNRQRRLRRWQDRGTHLARGGAAADITDHAIVIGQGRVGSVIVAALRRHNVPVVIVEQDRYLAERARKEGLTVIFGDATRPEVLHAARPKQAKLLVLAIPDRFLARRIIDLVRAANPTIDTVVRTHTDEEAAWLTAREVGLVVMSERETALGMAEYALRSFGAHGDSVWTTLEALRKNGAAA